MDKELKKKLDALNKTMLQSRGSDKQIIAAQKRIQNPDYANKLSKSLKGRIRTQEEIEKWRKTYNGSGERNNMYGKNHTEESKNKISINRKGKLGRTGPQTEETKQKMRKPRSEEGKANMRKPRLTKICPHCNHTGAGGIMLRWHFDNCKHKGENK
jgi:hypothetical protein